MLIIRFLQVDMETNKALHFLQHVICPLVQTSDEVQEYKQLAMHLLKKKRIGTETSSHGTMQLFRSFAFRILYPIV